MNNNRNRNYRNRDSYSSGVTMESKTKVIVTIILVILAAALCLGLVMSLRKDDADGDKNNGIFGGDTASPDNAGNDDPIETKPLDKSCTHEYGTEVKVKTAATCSEVGIGIKICKKCDGTIEVNIPATGNHVYTKFYEATDKTKHYSDCDECGGARKITEHTYKSYTIAATCTVDGKNVSECTKCNSKTETNIKATGHNVTTWLSFDNSQHVGLCTKCGESVKQNHNMGALVEVSVATCTEAGKKEATCSVCGYKALSSIPVLGHNYVDVTDDEQRVSTCSRCEDRKVHVHSYYDDITLAPTCTDSGLAFKICDCGWVNEELGEVDVPALGHKYVNGVCSRCSEICIHDYGTEVKVETAATCLKNGVGIKTCKRCSITVKVDIPAIDHNFTSWQSLDNSQHVRTCTNCSESFKEDHNLGEYAIVTAATCSTVGKKEAICSICKYKDSIDIPTLKHNYVVVTRGDEKEVSECSNCGGENIHIHVWKDEITSAPTCTDSGLAFKTCDCGWVNEELGEVEVSALGHKYVNGVCSRCGVSEK